MGAMCGATDLKRRCEAGHRSYVKMPHQADDHKCEICGVYHYFKQHGSHGTHAFPSPPPLPTP